MPLSSFEGTFRTIALYSPFAGIVYTPVSIFMGTYTVETGIRMIGVQILWLFFFYVLYRCMWEKGVREFTGVGQ